MARKLLVVIWHVLSEEVADDRQAKDEKVAQKLLRWGYKLRAKAVKK